MKDMPAIACQRFIRAIARQSHRHMLARHFTHAIGRQRRGIGKGFVKMMRQHIGQAEIIRRNRPAAMFGQKAFGDTLSIFGFIKRTDIKADRTGFHRQPRSLCHQGNHAAAVHAA